jgi:hypothetical protein
VQYIAYLCDSQTQGNASLHHNVKRLSEISLMLRQKQRCQVTTWQRACVCISPTLMKLGHNWQHNRQDNNFIVKLSIHVVPIQLNYWCRRNTLFIRDGKDLNCFHGGPTYRDLSPLYNTSRALVLDKWQQSGGKQTVISKSTKNIKRPTQI